MQVFKRKSDGFHQKKVDFLWNIFGILCKFFKRKSDGFHQKKVDFLWLSLYPLA